MLVAVVSGSLLPIGKSLVETQVLGHVEAWGEGSKALGAHTRSVDTRGAKKSHRQGVASFWVSSGEGEFIGGMGGCAVGVPGRVLSMHRGPKV